MWNLIILRWTSKKGNKQASEIPDQLKQKADKLANTISQMTYHCISEALHVINEELMKSDALRKRKQPDHSPRRQ